MGRKLFTVYTFARLNTRRFFRDKTAIFFTVAFPLIFLFVFGGIFGKNSSASFTVAVINQSQSQYATSLAQTINGNKIFKVDKDVTSLDQATTKMSHGQLDAALVIPGNFGTASNGLPAGQVKVVYTQNNEQAAASLQTVLQALLGGINAKLVDTKSPFTVTGQQVNTHSLSAFDYTFSGLLGFSIIGLGIFGPINVFPELKKQGILRRFHTTPLRVWQYFLATAASQVMIGFVSLIIQFAIAIAVFHLKVVGNYGLLAVFLALSIVMMLGIGLAIGGWASNERQAAPLANIVVFPMMFLSGTFFPRYLMPEWLQHVTSYLPLTPVIDGVRLIATEGQGIAQVLPQIGEVAGWAVIVYAIAFRVFRWE